MCYLVEGILRRVRGVVSRFQRIKEQVNPTHATQDASQRFVFYFLPAILRPMCAVFMAAAVFVRLNADHN